MTDAAFRIAYIPLQERFYRVAFHILEDREEALDAVQDLYLRLYQMLPTLDFIRNPAGYGCMVMRNLCIDRLRRNPDEQRIDYELVDVEDEGAEDNQHDELLQEVRRSLGRLPDRQRQVLTLHLRGMKDKEIAEQAGISALNVRVSLSLARRALRKMMQIDR